LKQPFRDFTFAEKSNNCLTFKNNIMKTKIENLTEAYQLLIAKIAVIAIILTITLIFTSCSKDDDVQKQIPEVDTQTTKDETVAQSEFDEVIVISEEAIDSAETVTGEITSLSIAQCAVVTIDTNANHIVIDFGDSGCVGIDGLTRSGKIEINYVGYYREPGSAVSIELNDYTVEGVAVSGQVSYVTVERNSEGNLEFTTSVTNGLITYPDGNYIRWNSTKTRTWLSGELTGELFDDTFQITGTSTGTNSNGVNFTTEITSPITIKTACWNENVFYPVSGIKMVVPEHLATRSIDYGNGTCDKDVTLSVGGYEYHVVLP
jgi:cell division protein FtsL